MNLKQLAFAAAVATSVAPAFAADQFIDLSSGQASFIGSAPLLNDGDDVITFTGLAAGTYNFLLSISAQNITGMTADLNGQAATIESFGLFSFAYLESTGSTPFVLTITGMPGNKGGYSGEFSVTAVPEPGTYALLLAGLGVVGFVARRRHNV